MDAAWLTNLNPRTAVIVPTRSLATILREHVAQHFIDSNALVWETPNILTWQDYLQRLWQSNRLQLNQTAGAHTLISASQGLLLWTRVIEESRRNEQSFTLLNVQQTARAVQRSWRMQHDWQISGKTVAGQAVADTQQFLRWAERYQALLSERGLMDDQLLLAHLLENQVQQPFDGLIWYAYDLVTTAQSRLNQLAESAGVLVEFRTPESAAEQDREYFCYSTADEELIAALYRARTQIEVEPGCQINLVIPDLQNCQAHVRELARNVFYPGAQPLQLQRSNLVYRFSLGEPLNRWSAIETALSIINLLKGRVSLSELSFLFRNQYLRSCVGWRSESRAFEKWLQRQRISSIGIDALPGLYQQHLVQSESAGTAEHESGLAHFLSGLLAFRAEMQSQLNSQKISSGYKTLAFHGWLEVLTNWLDFWGWSAAIANSRFDSVQFQLQQRWQSLLEEFAAMQIVQAQVGLVRVCEILQQMARDTVFLPKAAASPILISGVFEVIGRPADLTIVTGMHDGFPLAPPNDPFIADSLRKVPDYPAATSKGLFAQSLKVLGSLLAGVQRVSISYARQDSNAEGVERGVSPLFRQQLFETVPPSQAPAFQPCDVGEEVKLVDYSDIEGPHWQDPKSITGGSVIFENQSNCAFKAFATHQLRYTRDEEPEFGLDSLDRGNIVHRLLDKLWGALQTSQHLRDRSDQGTLWELVDSVVSDVVDDPQLSLLADKKALLQLEKHRLGLILRQWLLVEMGRPSDFSVVEREERRSAQFAGIGFHYVIDRLDLLADGRTVIVDYKTGTTARRDWQGARIRKPQLPLYVLALDQVKRNRVSGIAYAKVKLHECKFEELAEADIFKTESRYSLPLEEKWHDSRAVWPALLEQVAQDFLAGKADVNPIDENTCAYCDLQSLCRVAQLRAQTPDLTDSSGSTDLRSVQIEQ